MINGKMTEAEKLAATVNQDGEIHSFNGDNDIRAIIQKEKRNKAREEIAEMQDKTAKALEAHNKVKEEFSYDVNIAEIKPMFNRVIIKPFAMNPFQREVVSESGLIIAAGAQDLHIDQNPDTGRFEQQKEFIVTAAVIEVGPEVKWLKEGDAIYYRVDTAVPVPFFGQGFYSIGETQVIAVVNENLEKRFKNKE